MGKEVSVQRPQVAGVRYKSRGLKEANWEHDEGWWNKGLSLIRGRMLALRVAPEWEGTLARNIDLSRCKSRPRTLNPEPKP